MIILDFKKYFINESVDNIAKRIDDIYQSASMEEKVVYNRILSRFLKKDKNKYNINTYRENDIVLIEYWYNDMLTPVRIVEKKGGRYLVSHDVPDSKIRKAPNEYVKKSDIIDFFIKHEDDFNTEDIPLDINLYNSISLLSQIDKNNLMREILNSKVHEGVEVNSDNEIYTKSNLNTFLKCLTALNIPNDFKVSYNGKNSEYLTFKIESINKQRIVEVFDRFPSMIKFIDRINKASNIDIYFSLLSEKPYGKFTIVYGLILDKSSDIKIASFNFTPSDYKNLLESKNIYMKKFFAELKNFDFKKSLSLMKIKDKISEFSPDYYVNKKDVRIINNTIVFDFYGIGKWESGVMLTEEFNRIKDEFKKWLIGNVKNYNSLYFSVSAKDFWVTYKVKI